MPKSSNNAETQTALRGVSIREVDVEQGAVPISDEDAVLGSNGDDLAVVTSVSRMMKTKALFFTECEDDDDNDDDDVESDKATRERSSQASLTKLQDH